MNEKLTATERTRLRRMHERGRFDRETINSILDAMPLCHVGYTIGGEITVMPTFQWREGDHVYWHGSSANRGLRASEGTSVCLTVTLLDGLVMARSGFHHSGNYRSAMIFGRATKVTDPEVKAEKMRGLVEAYYPGRWDMLRPMTAKEAKATTVLKLPIEEASAKLRTGGPVDDDEDYALPIWAVVIPVRLCVGEPEPDPRNLPNVPLPDHVRNFSIG